MHAFPADLHLDRLIDLALTEDLGGLGLSGDITSTSTVPATRQAVGRIKAKEQLVVFGLAVAARVFHKVDDTLAFDIIHPDGTDVVSGTVVAEAKGNARSLLIAERTALNFVMRLSGIATQSKHIADVLRGTKTRAIDTRKTTPGWRALEKRAVAAGGCGNHRMGLFDGILIKDNHIEGAGSITAAVTGARANAHHLLKIEVEAGSLLQVQECLALDVDAILLDNMDDALLQQAVHAIRIHERKTGKAVVVEASGNMTIERLPKVAAAGVDLVSLGALTHQVRSVDLSMKIQLQPSAT